MTHDALAMVEYRSQPRVQIASDSEAGLVRARAAAAVAGADVAAAALIGDRSHAARCAADPLLVEIGEDDADLDPFFDALVADAEALDRRVLLIASASLIDPIAALAWHANIAWEFEPNEEERLAAVDALVAPAESRFEDIGREGQQALQKLSRDAGRIAATLAALAEDEKLADLAQADDLGAAQPPPLDAPAIRAMIRARRLRDHYFGSGLFADPAWDMLLDLMAARLEGAPVAVSSLCIAAAVPATTALRWVKALTDRGLFVRVADPHDRRRVFIVLSDDTVRALASYLRAVGRAGALPI
ncbi:MAG: winged helix DNA-binding protein [Sphingomonas sp.]